MALINNIDKLPLELYLMIFQHLDLKELMNCRLVNRKWKNLVDQFRIKDLAIINNESNWLYNKFNSNESLNYQNLFEPSNLILFQDALSNKIFKNLNYLNISYYLDWREFNIEILNQFHRLNQLDIHCLEVSGITRLNLPNLRILCIFDVLRAEIITDEFIEIDSPKLEILRVNEHLNELIRIVHAESVKNLQVNLCNSDLSSFYNLEIYQQDFASNINQDILSILPANLKELHLNTSIRTLSYRHIRSILAHLVSQKIKLNRFGLRMYFMGIQLVDGMSKLLDDCTLGFDYHKSHLKNYHLLSKKLPFFNQIDYDILINSRYRLPADFCLKFNNIQIISALKVKDQNQFINFLEQCPNLIQLKIKNSQVNQLFYNKLPTICSLVKLRIEKQAIAINYEFIYKFKKLFQFQTNQFISLDIAINSFAKCKYLKNFNIISDLEKVYIKKNSKDNFSLKCLNTDLNNNCILKDNNSGNRFERSNSIVIDRQNIELSELVESCLILNNYLFGYISNWFNNNEIVN